jgi:hypothetical protein
MDAALMEARSERRRYWAGVLVGLAVSGALLSIHQGLRNECIAMSESCSLAEANAIPYLRIASLLAMGATLLFVGLGIWTEVLVHRLLVARDPRSDSSSTFAGRSG